MSPTEAATPKGGQYSAALVRLATCLVVQAGLTFRGTARALAVVAGHWRLSLPTPCANTIASWLLRLGHFQLHRRLPQADDWAWFADLTLTIGTRKVLVIAGAPQSEMPWGEHHLRPTDLYLLHVAVLERSTHATILPELRLALQRTGPPRSIVTDEGSDVVKAVSQWRCEHPQVLHVLDLAHFAANLLKKRWTAQPRWKEFLQGLTETNARLRQTELAYLVSPRLRDKGRFMSVGVLLRFALRVLYWLDQGLADAACEEKYGWLRTFQADLSRWNREQRLVQQTLQVVRLHGWETDTLVHLEAQWAETSAADEDVVQRLRDFAKRTLELVRPTETVPGSTEALESSFGHWKRLVESGPSVGVSGLVLAVGSAMKRLPDQETCRALEATPLKKVWSWIQRNVGTTIQKLRTIFHRQTAPALT